MHVWSQRMEAQDGNNPAVLAGVTCYYTEYQPLVNLCGISALPFSMEDLVGGYAGAWSGRFGRRVGL